MVLKTFATRPQATKLKASLFPNMGLGLPCSLELHILQSLFFTASQRKRTLKKEIQKLSMHSNSDKTHSKLKIL